MKAGRNDLDCVLGVSLNEALPHLRPGGPWGRCGLACRGGDAVRVRALARGVGAGGPGGAPRRAAAALVGRDERNARLTPASAVLQESGGPQTQVPVDAASDHGLYSFQFSK